MQGFRIKAYHVPDIQNRLADVLTGWGFPPVERQREEQAVRRCLEMPNLQLMPCTGRPVVKALAHEVIFNDKECQLELDNVVEVENNDDDDSQCPNTLLTKDIDYQKISKWNDFVGFRDVVLESGI